MYAAQNYKINCEGQRRQEVCVCMRVCAGTQHRNAHWRVLFGCWRKAANVTLSLSKDNKANEAAFRVPVTAQ